LSGAATGAAVGDADLGPPPPATTGRKRRDASFFRGFFRKGRALGDLCTADATCTADDANSACLQPNAGGACAGGTDCTCQCVVASHYDEGGTCVTKADGTVACPATGCTGANQVCTGGNCACDTSKYKVNTDGACEVDVAKLGYGLGSCGTDAMDYLTIPGAKLKNSKTDPTFGSKICGSIFNVYGKYQPAAQNGVESDIYTFMTPFMINYHTDETEVAGETGNAGYCLQYTQLPCV